MNNIEPIRWDIENRAQEGGGARTNHAHYKHEHERWGFKTYRDRYSRCGSRKRKKGTVKRQFYHGDKSRGKAIPENNRM